MRFSLINDSLISRSLIDIQKIFESEPLRTRNLNVLIAIDKSL